MKHEQRIKRHIKLRKKIKGTAERPRLAVFRSNRFISAQIIDDVAGKTLVSASDAKFPVAKSKEGAPRRIANAEAVGTAIAEAAKAKKITKVVFDRAGFLYAGRVRALADAARKNGLEF
ncbi:MAG: 50S ribosomal protein L18 [Patescibacteria group bacterium]